MTMGKFLINVPQQTLDDLKARLTRTRWPEEIDHGWTFGTDRTQLRALVDRWAGSFDWRRQEDDMNRFAHFLRGRERVQRSLYPRARRWRSVAHADDRGARVRAFAAHGGDWGRTVTEQLARSHARSPVGVHLTDVPFWHLFQNAREVSHDEQRYLDATTKWQQKDGAYALIQGTRPYTLARGLNDSPVGLASWIVDKFHAWSDCDGDVWKSFTKDELLTNVTLYRVTETIGSSFLPYADFVNAGALTWTIEAFKQWAGSTSVPAAFAMFPKDISNPPREWAARFFNVQRWTEMPRGGHFAALEEPESLVDDIRRFFRPLRGNGNTPRGRSLGRATGHARSTLIARRVHGRQHTVVRRRANPASRIRPRDRAVGEILYRSHGHHRLDRRGAACRGEAGQDGDEYRDRGADDVGQGFHVAQRDAHDCRH